MRVCITQNRADKWITCRVLRLSEEREFEVIHEVGGRTWDKPSARSRAAQWARAQGHELVSIRILTDELLDWQNRDNPNWTR